MGATYTRQSSYSDGDVIQAADTNNEFDQLLAAFAASSGHTHDGTTAEGGPITKLLGNSLTLGAGTAGTDITVTFDGESNDGVLLWKEDEDYFEFSDDILVASTEKLQFRDTAIYINSSADGQLDLVADTEIQIAATTIDINGNADISGNLGIGGNLTVTGTTTFNGGTLTLGDADTDNIVFGGEVDSNIIPDDDNAYDLGSSSKEWKDIYIDGVAYLDAINFNGTAITSTAAEINVIDGDTSATSTTVADADRVVLNDNGTMKQVAVTDLSAYFDDEITAMPNLVTTAATTVGALNSGSITSGFGTIDTGSSTITTTGLITGGSLDIDDVVINGTTIGHTDDTDLITVASGLVTVAGEISVTTLDIGGTNVTSTATELNLLDGVSGLVQADFTKLAAVDATATELNIMDGDTSASSTTLADADRVVVNDAGTMKQVALTDFETYFESALDTLSNVTTVGALNSGSITSGFGAIDIGSSNLTATGTISLGATSFNDNAITNVGDIALDSISADGTDINVAVSDNSGTAFTIKQGSDAYLIVDTGNSSESISIGTGISGTAITLGHGTSEVTVGDNLTVTGNLTVSGTTTTVNSTTVNLNDHNIVLDSGNSTSAVINGAGITIEGGSGDDATFTYNTTGPQFELKLGSSFEDLQTAKLTATELDISGDVDVAGTLETDAFSINSTSVTSTGAELNLVDGSSAGTIVNSKAVIYGSSGEVNATTLQIAGTSITSTAAELNKLDGVTATTTELNIVDGDTSVGTTAVAGGDGIVTNDNGTMRQTSLDTFDTYLAQTTKTLTNKTLTTPTITTPVVNTGLQLKNGATSAGFIEFFEDSDNGTNKVTVIGPASTDDVTLTLPNTTGTIATGADATALAIALG